MQKLEWSMHNTDKLESILVSNPNIQEKIVYWTNLLWTYT